MKPKHREYLSSLSRKKVLNRIQLTLQYRPLLYSFLAFLYLRSIHSKTNAPVHVLLPLNFQAFTIRNPFQHFLLCLVEFLLFLLLSVLISIPTFDTTLWYTSGWNIIFRPVRLFLVNLFDKDCLRRTFNKLSTDISLENFLFCCFLVTLLFIWHKKVLLRQPD